MLWLTLVVLLLSLPASASQEESEATQSGPVSVVNGELGPCAVQFTIKNAAGKPVEDAKVRVHIEHGFLGLHRLDLEASTNNEGKVRFEGLPDNPRHGLLFRASKDTLQGTGFYDPTKNCKAEHLIVLVRGRESQGQEQSEPAPKEEQPDKAATPDQQQ